MDEPTDTKDTVENECPIDPEEFRRRMQRALGPARMAAAFMGKELGVSTRAVYSWADESEAVFPGARLATRVCAWIRDHGLRSWHAPPPRPERACDECGDMYSPPNDPDAFSQERMDWGSTLCAGCIDRDRYDFVLQVPIDVRYADGRRRFCVFDLVREYRLMPGTLHWTYGRRGLYRFVDLDHEYGGLAPPDRVEQIGDVLSHIMMDLRPFWTTDNPLEHDRTQGMHSYTIGEPLVDQPRRHFSEAAADEPVGWCNGQWVRFVVDGSGEEVAPVTTSAASSTRIPGARVLPDEPITSVDHSVPWLLAASAGYVFVDVVRHEQLSETAAWHDPLPRPSRHARPLAPVDEPRSHLFSEPTKEEMEALSRLIRESAARKRALRVAERGGRE